MQLELPGLWTLSEVLNCSIDQMYLECTNAFIFFPIHLKRHLSKFLDNALGYLCSICDIDIIGGEKSKVFLWNSFEHLKEIDQQIWTLSCLAKNVLSSLFQAVFKYIYRNTLLLMMMGQNWGYESKFDAIISNKPYWNYHDFWTLRGFVKFFSAWRDIKIGLLFARGIVVC